MIQKVLDTWKVLDTEGTGYRRYLIHGRYWIHGR